jgi:hypothetical protein
MEVTIEASAHMNLYLEAKPGETKEEVTKRLEKFIEFIQDVHPDLSAQVYDVSINEF